MFENAGFLCAQRFDWPGWLDFAVPCELPFNTPPILQRSPTNSLPSGHPDALNHKNRKGLSCKNGVDSIPSGKLKGRDAFSLSLSPLECWWFIGEPCVSALVSSVSRNSENIQCSFRCAKRNPQFTNYANTHYLNHLKFSDKTVMLNSLTAGFCSIALTWCVLFTVCLYYKVT